MSNALKLERYSFGVGDRFARQAKAQLRAFVLASAQGVEVTPVWNKSHREHTTVGSEPPSVSFATPLNAVRRIGSLVRSIAGSFPLPVGSIVWSLMCAHLRRVCRLPVVLRAGER